LASVVNVGLKTATVITLPPAAVVDTCHLMVSLESAETLLIPVIPHFFETRSVDRFLTFLKQIHNTKQDFILSVNVYTCAQIPCHVATEIKDYLVNESFKKLIN